MDVIPALAGESSATRGPCPARQIEGGVGVVQQGEVRPIWAERGWSKESLRIADADLDPVPIRIPAGAFRYPRQQLHLVGSIRLGGKDVEIADGWVEATEDDAAVGAADFRAGWQSGHDQDTCQ